MRELLLELDHAEFPYQVGQSVGVVASDEHIRLFSVADLPDTGPTGMARIRICVKRIGQASEFLCDLKPGEQVTLTGPHGLPFEVPEDHTANLILFCTGTGIAPFRAFVKYLYEKVPDWTGPVWLFYGAKNPLETLYMNDEQDDFANYYDLDSFVAFKALGPNPRWPDSIPWDRALDARADELLAAFDSPNTRVLWPVRRRCATSSTKCSPSDWAQPRNGATGAKS
ncbi:MAG: hypothetical protein R2724_09390 [Bryobacterales bacterium]